MSTIDASNALSMQDFFSTTLSGTISSTDTVLTLASVPTASEGFLVLELGTANQEIVYYNAKGASTVTCPSVARGRAQGGTTAVAHTTGASVKQTVNSDFWKELQNGNANTGMQTYFNEGTLNYVASGLIWTGDSLGSTRNGSMTSGVVYIAGKRVTVAAVSAHTFTASKDTYVDVTTTSGNNTGTLVYTEASNNGASPALAASSVRLAIVVTAAGSIAASTSIMQGGTANINPTISSQILNYGLDSLGNSVYPSNPTKNMFRFVPTPTAAMTTTSASFADFTNGVSFVYKTGGTAERIYIWFKHMTNISAGSANAVVTLSVNGTDQSPGGYVGSTTNLTNTVPFIVDVPANTSVTIKPRGKTDASTLNINMGLSDATFKPAIYGWSEKSAS